MCGIFGVFGSSLSQQSIQLAKSKIKHRGPDDFHYISSHSNDYTIAAVRLAFQDIINGRQPISKSLSSNKVVAAFNGEIYNYREIKAAMEKEV